MRLEKEDEVGVAEIQETTINPPQDPLILIRERMQYGLSLVQVAWLVSEVDRLRGLVEYAALVEANRKKPGDRFTPPKKKRKR